MTKFIGARDGKIITISDSEFISDNLKVLPLPDTLQDVDTTSLILDYCVRDGNITKKKQPCGNAKVAFISNWKMQCGISTYAENLFPEIFPYVLDYKLFIEENETSVSSIFEHKYGTLNVDKIEICWRRGYSLQTLVDKIKEYNPDVIIINHEWGIFPHAPYFLSLLTQLSQYRIITIMHSIFPNHEDKTIIESALSEMVVHLAGAKTHLSEKKKLSSKIYVVPHGSDVYVDHIKPWNFYKTNHNFIQFGFLFSYKGWGNSLEAVARLKEKYADVYFTGLLSESPFAKIEHQRNYDTLIKSIEILDIKDNVGLIRQFQPDNVIKTFLRMNKAAVFPYTSSVEHKVFGASGACRYAMSQGIPVITSNIEHFSDLPSIKAETSKEIATQLEILFENETTYYQQIQKQNEFLISISWSNVAKKYLEIINN